MIDYKCIYHFPQNVSGIKNQKGVKLKRGKTVMQSYDAKTLLNNDVDLGNVISF